jgi:serine O-acetyltransferase
MSDVQAALDDDPSAESGDEVIMVYPGILSISVHRLAHELVLLPGLMV